MEKFLIGVLESILKDLLKSHLYELTAMLKQFDEMIKNDESYVEVAAKKLVAWLLAHL